MKFKILFLFLLLTQLIYGQTNNYKFIGTIISENFPPISFKLELNEKDGLVNGYSITNINSKDQTKSTVQGIYLKKSKIKVGIICNEQITIKVFNNRFIKKRTICYYFIYLITRT